MDYNGKKVFICEDDTSLQQILQELTTDMGFEVTVFNNGKEALIGLNSTIPDLILSDINMPLMTGIDFLKELYSRECKLPVIFLTGETNPNYFKEAVSYGYFDFLQKPMNSEKLSSAIAKAMTFGYQEPSKFAVQKIRKSVSA